MNETLTRVTRILVETNPFLDRSRVWHEQPWTRARWIGDPHAQQGASQVWAFRLVFRIAVQTSLRIHVSADEGYYLYLDGSAVGRGNETGDASNWFFESYDIALPPGEHIFVARTWWLGPNAPSAYAQCTLRPAFLVFAEGILHEEVSTGIAPWEVKALPGYTFIDPREGDDFVAVAAKVDVEGTGFEWGYKMGGGGGWNASRSVAVPSADVSTAEIPPGWGLRPAMLPPMRETYVSGGKVRHLDQVTDLDDAGSQIARVAHREDLAREWGVLLQANEPLTVPARSCYRIVVDLEAYRCVYPELITTGGARARVEITIAESLYDQLRGPAKADRNTVDGKYFRGVGNTFRPDGGALRQFETFFWEAGRYVCIIVETQDEPLVIESLKWLDSRYPLDSVMEFTSSDLSLDFLLPMCVSTLEACSHDTYMDCPHYEQLMYVGDARVEALVTYVLSADSRLPRKALEFFDKSRGAHGLTQARYPSRINQIIPPFSLTWIGMLHDYALWRGDPLFVATMMPGARAVLDRYCGQLDSAGLVTAQDGWNFVDWVGDWPDGVPPSAAGGVNATVHFQVGTALHQAAELETFLDEPELAARHIRRRDALASAANASFWNDERGLYAEDVTHQSFSEHSQCMALMSGSVPIHRQERLERALLDDGKMDRVTVYFAHYLFEAFRIMKRPDRILSRLDPWREAQTRGLLTAPEEPEPSRSDCHAWSAHPAFHLATSIVGIRPASLGFERVLITPQLGPLLHASATIAHPKGLIKVALRSSDGRLRGTVALPDGLSGTIALGGTEKLLTPGCQSVDLPGSSS